MAREILELALVFGLAAVLGLVARVLRQPLILAYIATGIIIGAFGFTPVATNGLYQLFSTLGVMLLLFLVGLEIKLSSLRFIGSSAGIIALGQMAVTFVFGYASALLFGLTLTAAAYIGLAVAFSSTIVVVKLLSEKKDLNSLYGKLSVGVLVWQDVAAMGALLFLTGWRVNAGFQLNAVLTTFIIGGVVLAVMLGLGRWVMPKIFHQVARSPELVLISSLAWVFIVVATVKSFGLSIEIGGFLAGLSLANSSEHFHIAHRITPLRDFFLLLFFVTLGTAVAGAHVSGQIGLVLFFIAVVVFGKPLIVWGIMSALGYHRRTSFLTGLTMGQISEFSLVIVAVGVGLKQIDGSVATIITTIMVLTIGVSSFGILHNESFYQALQPILKMFQRSKRRREDMPSDIIHRAIILIGAHRTGEQVLEHLPKGQVAVIDFDPDIVRHLRRRGYAAVYGDLTDPDIFDLFDRKKMKLVISTSPAYEDNVSLVSKIAKERGVGVVVRAENETEARHLYKLGADYVLLPQLTAGQHLGNLVEALRTGHSVSRHRDHDLRHLAHQRL